MSIAETPLDGYAINYDKVFTELNVDEVDMINVFGAHVALPTTIVGYHLNVRPDNRTVRLRAESLTVRVRK